VGYWGCSLKLVTVPQTESENGWIAASMCILEHVISQKGQNCRAYRKMGGGRVGVGIMSLGALQAEIHLGVNLPPTPILDHARM